LTDFNAELSNWNTAGVTNMGYMFYVRSSPCLAPLPRIC